MKFLGFMSSQFEFHNNPIIIKNNQIGIFSTAYVDTISLEKIKDSLNAHQHLILECGKLPYYTISQFYALRKPQETYKTT